MRTKSLQICLWTLIIQKHIWPRSLLSFQKRRYLNSRMFTKNFFWNTIKRIMTCGKKERKPRFKWLIKISMMRTSYMKLLMLNMQLLLESIRAILRCQVSSQWVQSTWIKKMQKEINCTELLAWKIKLQNTLNSLRKMVWHLKCLTIILNNIWTISNWKLNLVSNLIILRWAPCRHVNTISRNCSKHSSI